MENINGFEIVRYLERRRNNLYVLAICKECKKEWVTALYTLKTKLSCGCKSWKKLKPLPPKINGFKVIKCHGYDQERMVRWATVECKECQRIYDVDPNKLQYRKHCGCLVKDAIACKYVKSHPQLAQTYKHMISRCYNKNNKDYYNYGARGVRVCKEWKKDRNLFCEWALNNGFENNKNLSIDRIDNKKGYKPENCKWSTATIQARNTRRTILTMELARRLREDAKTMKQKDLSKKYKVSMATVSAVVNFHIWKEV